MNHEEKAQALFLEGCNCAQAVFAAFCDVTGFSRQEAMRLASSFGGGVGRMREICGALSGAFLAIDVYKRQDHGQCVLIRADRSGELDRQTLIPKKEKLDSCYLTREGMVACLSIDEDTDQFHRELTLLSAREDAPVSYTHLDVYKRQYRWLVRFS